MANIEKSLSGIAGALGGTDGPEIELEIESPTDGEVGVTLNPDGSVSIDTEDEEKDCGFGDNLAEKLDEDYMATLATELIEQFNSDLQSRKEWITAYLDGLKYVGLKYEHRTDPWPDACGVFHPMLAEAVVRFQSEAISETFPAMGPVKTLVKGKETKENLAAARRVSEDMNIQLTDIMTEYRPEHERMLWSLPLAGTAFKKVYHDGVLDRQTAVFVPAEDVVMPFGASSVDTAERVTHIMRVAQSDMLKLINSKFYRDVDLQEPDGSLDDVEQERQTALGDGYSAVQDYRHRLLEMQVELDIEGFEEELPVPYTVTIERTSNKILSIYRNYIEDDDKRKKRQHFVQYTYVPGSGAYGYGLIHLIGGYAQAATSLTRQLVDSGTLSNLQAGFKARGMRIKGDEGPLRPGEWRDVDVPSGTIRDNLLPLPYKEPSQTLFNLLVGIVEEGKSFISASDLNVADMSGQAPVGTTLALLERQLKVTGAIQARLHYSMRQEFRLLKELIRDCDDDEYGYDVEGAERPIKQQDYDMVEVIPVSDPNASTMAQKVVMFQTITQMAQQFPGVYDNKVLNRQMLESLGVKNVEKLVPMDDDLVNTDPVTENQNILSGKPIKAFLMQDHEAHIQVHMAAAQDPKIMQLLENNPNAQAIAAALQSHVAEHVGYAYRKQIEEQMGISLPPEDQPLPPEMEVALSRMEAQAAQKVLQSNQAEAAQQQAQQTAQDPMVQMQQKELEQKDRELSQKDREIALKEKALLADVAHKAGQLDLKKEEIENKNELAGATLSSKLAMDQDKMDNSTQIEGVRLGIDMASKMYDMEMKKSESKKKGKKAESGGGE